MSAFGTLRNMGKAGVVLLLAYAVAVPLGFAGDIGKAVLYLSVILILLSSFDSPRPIKIFKNLLGKIGGLAFFFWLVLVIFNIALVPLTGAQLFWAFVAAFVIRMAIEIP